MYHAMRAFFFCTLLLLSMPAMATDITLLKGMYFYNFIRFTAWPKNIDTTKEVNVSVIHGDSFSSVLRAISQKSHFLPKMLVKDCRKLHCLDQIQAVFIRDITEVKQQYMLEHLVGIPILTISDQIGFLKRGGMIELQEVAGRLVFSINVVALNQSGLYISADILGMAQKVITKAATP